MAENALQTPYATALPYALRTGDNSSWMDEYDVQRMRAYNLYDDLYNNDPTQFRLMLRSDADDRAIYLPLAKQLVKSLARFVGKSWGYRVSAPEEGLDDEDAEPTTPEQIALAQKLYGELFARERLLSLFNNAKREWLRRGDWCWFVSADPLKREGRRVSVRMIDPRRYFPLYRDPLDASRLTGQQIIEEVLLPDGKTFGLLVQTWLKYTDPEHPNYLQVEPEEGFDIVHSVQAFKYDNFADPEKRESVAHPSNLPPDYIAGIGNLPIYHIRCEETTDDPFGRSVLSGIESLLVGLNQSATDEDMALAYTGLGMYWTTSGAPVDEVTGQAVAWKLGPKRVVEVDQDTTFEKVPGVDSVQPFQDHMEMLKGDAAGTMGLSDVSIGTADNSVAESGIALSIRFSPTVDAVRELNATINGTLTQMFWDLKSWFAAFEQIDLGGAIIESVTNDDDLVPFNREARWKELMEGVAAGVFTAAYAVQVLADEFGYVFPDGYSDDLEAAAAAQAAALDPFADRAAQEAAAPDDEE